MTEALLAVEGLKKHFRSGSGLFGDETVVRAVDGIEFDIDPGETFALVGESGSGKTTVGRTIMRLSEPTAGTIRYRGRDITSLGGKELRQLRQHMQIVFQDPTSSLNPKKRIVKIIREPLDVHEIGSKSARTARAYQLLEQVELPADFAYRYPHQLSGGQKQRVAIARALALNPQLIVLDEPTSALDVSVQANIVRLLDSLQEDHDLTYLFITHDLSLVRSISDRVGVMYGGKLMEVGPREQLFSAPANPYTHTLLSAIRPVYQHAASFESLDRRDGTSETAMINRSDGGCVYLERCSRGDDACADEHPPLEAVETEDHRCACYHPVTD